MGWPGMGMHGWSLRRRSHRHQDARQNLFTVAPLEYCIGELLSEVSDIQPGMIRVIAQQGSESAASGISPRE